MTNLLLSVLALVSALLSADALQCYVGRKSFGEPKPGSGFTEIPIRLQECAPTQQCCFYSASFPGMEYRCSSECDDISNGEPSHCEKPQDAVFCYCKDNSVKDCMPDPSNIDTGNTINDNNLNRNNVDDTGLNNNNNGNNGNNNNNNNGKNDNDIATNEVRVTAGGSLVRGARWSLALVVVTIMGKRLL